MYRPERSGSGARSDRPATERRQRHDDWEPPKWTHPKVTAYDLEPEDRRAARRRTERRAEQRQSPARDGYLLGMAIAPAVTFILALVVSVVPGLSGTGDVPIGIVVVLITQVAALAVIGQTHLQAWSPSWVSVGFLTSVMLPMLALQVSLLHEPYVSIAMDSAGPAIIATGVLLSLYLAFAAWTLWVGLRAPEITAILLLPPSLAIPALIGEHGTIDQRSALLILAEVTLITTVLTAFAWLFPGWPQLMTAAGALAIELIRLWVSGRGPWRHETSGAIVNTIYVVMLIVVVLTVVLVPVLAAGLGAPARRTGARRI
jgi:hypothetical protein